MNDYSVNNRKPSLNTDTDKVEQTAIRIWGIKCPQCYERSKEKKCPSCGIVLENML